jgi:serine protease AprX
MRASKHPVIIRVKSLLSLLILSTSFCISGQAQSYPYFYRIFLRDKGNNSLNSYSASDLLSPKAIQRRHKAGIEVPVYSDIPVNKNYLDRISGLGLKLHTTSKWMNTALFKSQSPFDISLLLALPFVRDVKNVKSPGKKSLSDEKLNFKVVQADLPAFDRPITMVNGFPMHASGFDGKNILIAILDGGFFNADVISSLNDLRRRNGIKKTYDFVQNNENVYNASSHGTAVLSVLAGKLEGQIEGTAPGADYLLLKTEDVGSEFPCEEDFWASGAEYADSSGADIISSSLGYFTFDDPTLNYKTSDLDGNTAFVTRVADMAASKGILVVNSAGNERNQGWKKIIFPADGDSVVAAGAVDGSNIIADFSSAGPSADGRIKPDNVTMGVNVPVQIDQNLTGRSNGTSFSCPVLSGMAACLLQAVPQAVNTDIIKVLHSSADRYNNPDSLYGYGIPDIVLALNKLQNIYLKVPDEGAIVYPNPTSVNFEIIFRFPPENVTIEIFSTTGKLISRKNYSGFAGRTLSISDLQQREQGIYIIRIGDASGSIVRKIIKLKKL